MKGLASDGIKQGALKGRVEMEAFQRNYLSTFVLIKVNL